MRKNDFNHFQNVDCRYFPCHDTVPLEDFNCLFCYCPLMFIGECGGRYTIMESGFKDCSKCTRNHDKDSLIKGYISEQEYQEVFIENSYETDNGIRLIYMTRINEDYLAKAIQGEYKQAILFTHYAIWSEEATEEIKDEYISNILPLLESGKIIAVFAGDYIKNAPIRSVIIRDIPHYTCSWSHKGICTLKLIIGKSLKVISEVYLVDTYIIRNHKLYLKSNFSLKVDEI